MHSWEFFRTLEFSNSYRPLASRTLIAIWVGTVPRTVAYDVDAFSVPVPSVEGEECTWYWNVSLTDS